MTLPGWLTLLWCCCPLHALGEIDGCWMKAADEPLSLWWGVSCAEESWSWSWCKIKKMILCIGDRDDCIDVLGWWTLQDASTTLNYDAPRRCLIMFPSSICSSHKMPWWRGWAMNPSPKALKSISGEEERCSDGPMDGLTVDGTDSAVKEVDVDEHMPPLEEHLWWWCCLSSANDCRCQMTPQWRRWWHLHLLRCPNAMLIAWLMPCIASWRAPWWNVPQLLSWRQLHLCLRCSTVSHKALDVWWWWYWVWP